MTNDQANYYSRITSITVNEKNASELKGKFLDELNENAFSGTNEEDAVEHIEYFLKIVDPIDLPNVNQDKLRVVIFPISLVGDAWSQETPGDLAIGDRLSTKVKVFLIHVIGSLKDSDCWSFATSFLNKPVVIDKTLTRIEESRFVLIMNPSRVIKIDGKETVWSFMKLILLSQETPGDLATGDHLSPKVKVFLIPVISR
ncbi:hypothetical protein Tco_0103099 [Tanacetum coccineum]